MTKFTTLCLQRLSEGFNVGKELFNGADQRGMMVGISGCSYPTGEDGIDRP
jgi:hypothetical protein